MDKMRIEYIRGTSHERQDWGGMDIYGGNMMVERC